MKTKYNIEERTALRVELFTQLEQGTINLGEATRTMRFVVGKTQKEYAHWLGIAPRTLIDLERGVGNPTLSTLKIVAKPFGLNVVFRQSVN